MSQNLRDQEGGEQDIIRTSGEGRNQQNYFGFEGMNYEQFRQPYNVNHKNRSSTTDEHKDRKRPNES